MIGCNEYDTIEIVCMYKYPIKLTLKTGTVLSGVALDTQRNINREECIKIEEEGVEVLVVLDELSTLEVCIANPHFKTVSFT
ncbi:Rho-binding antiterminator [Colwellia sp. UCD-KL20]|uniref:Rho-binding antiterminator n=1 Tax=Colwellia sp. UCD-KL20 TaxID=1917165 RepID=UPI0009712D7F|nr:Rho-binding antiterminator [Colwellia sp. UCD-KL20]